MKKLLSAALIAMLLMAQPVLFAQAQPRENKLKVVVTDFPAYDFTRQIAGDRVELSMLLSPGTESHSYEPTPKDIIKIQGCDMFIYGGGEGEAWVRKVLEPMDKSGLTTLTMMDCVELVEEESVEGMEEEHEEENEGPAYDEHVWTSPRNAKLIVEKIAAALCEADDQNAATYRENAEAYLVKLDALDGLFQSVVDAGSRKTIIFGDRFPFRYFADAYGLSYFAAFPGCATETEPSARTVKFLIDKVKEEGIPVVFHIELSNEKMAHTISEETGAKVLLLHACHNISKRDFDGGETYLSLMERNVENLKEALR